MIRIIAKAFKKEPNLVTLVADEKVKEVERGRERACRGLLRIVSQQMYSHLKNMSSKSEPKSQTILLATDCSACT